MSEGPDQGHGREGAALDPTTQLAANVIARLTAAGDTVAVAESLTGGLVCAVLTRVPGASAALRGGVVAYATELKATLLGVDGDILAARGAVDPDVARGMAAGARARLGATYGVATTGVAGPDEQDGHPVGTVHVAVIGPAGSVVRSYRFRGDRAAVRRQSVDSALSVLLAELPEGAALARALDGSGGSRVAADASDGRDPEDAEATTDEPRVDAGIAGEAAGAGVEREATASAGRWGKAWTSSAARPTDPPGTVDQ